jgi:hypothetical protein
MAGNISLKERLSDLSTDETQPLDLNSFKRMKRNQTLSVVFVAVLGVLIVFFGFWKLGDSLQVPFPGGDQKYDPNSKVVIETEEIKAASEEDPQVLKQRDTDQDGLSDFDELYIYQTSPYLADTDSDGMTDIDEIKNQEDPTCPSGQNCFRTVDLYEQEQKELEQKESSALSVVQIRALLLQTGQFTVGQLDLFSNDEIKAFYQEILDSNPELKKVASEVEMPTEPQNGVTSVVEAEHLNPEQIRDLLRQQGVSESDIDLISDEDLQKLYQEAFSLAKEKMDQ